MKRLFLIGAILFTATWLSAQERSLSEWFAGKQVVKSPTLIGDFTITDSDGVTHNLYTELDAGKVVFLDLFFTT